MTSQTAAPYITCKELKMLI